MPAVIVQSDCIEFLNAQPPDSVDLILGSPPYEEARLYLENGKNMGISRATDEWVEWMVEVYKASHRVCKGLVAFVVAGQTRGYRWSAGPALLMAELHRAGLNLRNPPIFSRVGIPGSGGPDWLRSDYEWIICTSRPGRLPWSDNTACGHPPKWAPGGEMSHRVSNGARVNQWGHSIDSGATVTAPDRTVTSKGKRPSHREKGKVNRKTFRDVSGKGRFIQASLPDGTTEFQSYIPPTLANPGNIIECVVGGGVMGSELCHINEAPYPEDLARFFVLSFCPPGGTVCDVFAGSGTTAAVAIEHGRNFTGCDLRQSQVDLSLRRVSAVTPDMFAEKA
jgi:hypothetical protein